MTRYRRHSIMLGVAIVVWILALGYFGAAPARHDSTTGHSNGR